MWLARKASFVVRYRLGGRAYPVMHGGSFKTLREATQRKNVIAGELAAGRNPAEALAALSALSTRRRFAEWAAAFEASRVDVSAGTAGSYKAHLLRILPTFGDRDPETISPADVQECSAPTAIWRPLVSAVTSSPCARFSTSPRSSRTQPATSASSCRESRARRSSRRAASRSRRSSPTSRSVVVFRCGY